MTMELLTDVTEPVEEWPQLVPLNTPNLPRLNLNNFPGWVGDYSNALSIASEGNGQTRLL